MPKQCVPGALSPPPPPECLGTKLADSMHKNFHCKAHGCLQVFKESIQVALSIGLCFIKCKISIGPVE